MEKLYLKQILSDQLQRFLRLPNSYIKRQVINEINLNLSEPYILMGVRRSGKSFTMKILANAKMQNSSIGYIDFDDPRLSSFLTEDFQTVFDIWLEERRSDTPLYIFIDEPQNIQGWEKWITFFSKEDFIRVVATGSNAKMLSSDMATHLTGRHRETMIYPLSIKEFLSAETTTKLPLESNFLSTVSSRAAANKLVEKYYQYGGFPKALLEEDKSILQQYYKDILHKDIIPRIQANRSKEISELGNILLSTYANLVNKTRLANVLGLKQSRTINRYISSFLDAFLFYEVRMFSHSATKQQRSLPKYYAIDHGLVSANVFNVAGNRSRMLENIIFLSLKNNGYEVFYWKGQNKDWEVDFVARKQGAETIAIQVCIEIQNEKIFERETRSLLLLKKELRINKLYLIVENINSIKQSIPKQIELIDFLSFVLG